MYNELFICMNFAIMINMKNFEFTGENAGVLLNSIYFLIQAGGILIGPPIIVGTLFKKYRANKQQIRNMNEKAQNKTTD